MRLAEAALKTWATPPIRGSSREQIGGQGVPSVSELLARQTLPEA